MTINSDWLQWAIYWPAEDEEGYDGVHDGGIKGLADNAPAWAQEAYKEYKAAVRHNGRGV